MPLNPLGSTSSTNGTPLVPVYVGDTAGGDLSGTYPNPVIRSNAVTTAKIADGAVTTAKIADGAVTAAKLSINSIFPLTSGSQIISGLITNAHLYGQILTSKLSEGSKFINNYAAQVVSGIKVFQRARSPNSPTAWFDLTNKYYVDTLILSGVISGFSSPSGTAGGGLTGTYPNPTIANNAISGNRIVANSILNGHLAQASISGGVVAQNSLTWGQMANSVRVQYNTNIIGTRKTINFNAGSGINLFIQDNPSADRVDIILSGAIGAGGSPSGPAGGDLTGTYPNPTIANSAVSGNKIHAESILQGHINSGYVNLYTNQSISGVKLFHNLPQSYLAPTAGIDLVNKTYVDGQVSVVASSISGINAGLINTQGRVTTLENNTSGINSNLITTQHELLGAKNTVSGISGKVIDIVSVLSGHNHDNRYVTVLVNNNVIGTKRRIHFIANSGINIFAQENIANESIDITLSGGASSGGSPSGPAGGDLTGTYPNPTIANSAVSGNKIASQAILEGHVKDFQDKFNLPNTKLIISGVESRGRIIGTERIQLQAADGTLKGYISAGLLTLVGDASTRQIEMSQRSLHLGSLGKITWTPGDAYANEGDIQNVANTAITIARAAWIKVTDNSTGLGGITVSGLNSLGGSVLSGSNYLQRAFGNWPELPNNFATKEYVDTNITVVASSISGINGNLITTQHELLGAKNTVSGINTRVVVLENNTSGINNNLTSVQVKTNDIESTLSGHVHDNRYITVQKDGVVVGTKRQINFITGPGITFEITESIAQQRIDVIISGTGSSGGSADVSEAIRRSWFGI